MKSFFSTKSRVRPDIREVVSIAGASLLTVARAGDEFVVRRMCRETCRPTGVGLESFDRLSSIAGTLNCKPKAALNAVARLSGVQVVIAEGKTIPRAVADNAWVTAELPTGNCQVSALLAGNGEKRRAPVAPSQLKTVDLRWSSE